VAILQRSESTLWFGQNWSPFTQFCSIKGSESDMPVHSGTVSPSNIQYRCGTTMQSPLEHRRFVKDLKDRVLSGYPMYIA
jgi:hypothetical protein